MPFCARCGQQIQRGRYCSQCELDDRHSNTAGSEQSGWDYTDCDHCDGHAWVYDPKQERKVDCPICNGFGMVPVMADGGDTDD